MRRAIVLALAFAVIAAFAGAGRAADDKPADNRLARLSAFITAFTELGMHDMPNARNLKTEEYVRFGVLHAVLHGAAEDPAEPGRYSVEPHTAATNVLRYFGIQLARNVAVPERGIDLSDGVYRASKPKLTDDEDLWAWAESTRQAGDEIEISGVLYDPDAPDRTVAGFTARAVPFKWNGREAWALSSLSRHALEPDEGGGGTQ